MKGFKRKTTELGWCVLVNAGDRVLLAYSQDKTSAPQFVNRELADKSLAEVIKELAKEYKLAGVPCTYLMPSHEYRVFLSDPLTNVPSEERYDALRWLVQDLIDFPAEEAVVDAFDVPVGADQTPKIYLVVSKLVELKACVEMLEAAELMIERISIPELGLNHYLALQQDTQKLQAVFYSQNKIVRIMLCKLGMVRMLRELGPADELLQIDNCSRLVSALHRSFEFYQSSLGAQLPMQLLIPASLQAKNEWRNAFAEALNLPLVALDLPSATEFSVLQGSELAGMSLLGEVSLRDERISEQLKGGIANAAN